MSSAMALVRLPSALSMSTLLRSISPYIPSQSPILGRIAQWSSRPISASISIPAISLNIPGLISDIWEGILKAVPKKKTSHMKKRHRQLAGKALKDVNAVNSCPGCGKPKKAHTLCPYCVAEIQHSWKQEAKRAAKATTETGAAP